ncbi:MAG TPA: terpene synthase family protein, partial [Chloroflexota bacterium]|nr:terpene synthase family protein [Chloroflexota bacterium]
AYRRHGIAVLPSYEEYVENGLNSIGGPPHVWSAIITTGDSSVPWHLRHLREMERVSSTCVRLANDLQSHSKEIAEEKLNSLLVVSHALIRRGLTPVDALREARVYVQGAIARELADLDGLEAQARTKTGRPEAVTANIARFVCDFYAHYDYHTFTKETEPGERSDN